MSSRSKLDRLKAIPLLRELEENELEKLSCLMEERRVKKGQLVVRARDEGQFIMFVLMGRLNVVLGNGGSKELMLDILGPGDFFGELALLTGEPRSADVEAAEDSLLLVLSQPDFEKHVLMNSGLTRALLRDLAKRLRKTSIRAGDLALLDVSRRLGRVLASLVDASSLNHPAVKVIEKRPTHRELAALTGTSREVVTRALKELQAAGHIEIEGKKLVVHSLPV